MRDLSPEHSTETAATAGAPSRATARLGRGDVVGRYVVVDFIDRGGMGVVYKAFDPELNRPVALKLVAVDHRPDHASETTQRARLLREAQALARLSHPNIVTVHDVGTHGDGVFVAMEFVEGQTLKAYLAAGPHPRAEILEVLAAAGRGLAAAHRAGITHRDFKPGNVILGADGRVRVIDFGLARSTLGDLTPDPSASGPEAPLLLSQVTVAGRLVGTPRYMAPEQHAARDATERSDQFAFCVVLFEALYRAYPFAGETRDAIVENIRQGAVTRPAAHDVPEWLDRVLARGLEPDPDRRFPSMDALLAALADDPAVARAHARARRLRLGLVGLAVASTAVAGWVVLRHPAGRPSPCREAGAKLGGVWDATVQAAIRQRFAQVGRAYAHDTYPRVARLLDGYAEGWVSARRDACEATHVRGEQSAALLDLRMQCLDRKLGQLRALTALFGAADADVVDKSVQAASSLDAVAACADAQVLLARTPPPADAATADKVRALRDRLADAEALYRAGKYKDAVALLGPLALDAAGVGYQPVQAEIAALTSTVAQKLSDTDTAIAAGDDAVTFALATGDEEVLARGYTSLLLVLGYDLDKIPEAEVYLRFADATLRHLGDEGDLRWRWTKSAADVYLAHGDIPKALDYLERARTLGLRLYGPDHHLVGTVLSNLGIAYQQQGDGAKARAAYTDAFHIFEQALGPAHPIVGAAHNNLGVAAFIAHDYAAARREYEAGLAILEAALGPDHPRVATTLVNLGEACLAGGALEPAAAAYDRARDIQERTAGPDSPDAAEALAGLGAVRVAQGRFADARTALERALAICGADRCAADFGHVPPDARFGLAQALWETGADRARAVALARQALAERAADTSTDAVDARARYQGWLDAHARP